MGAIACRCDEPLIDGAWKWSPGTGLIAFICARCNMLCKIVPLDDLPREKRYEIWDNLEIDHD